MKDGKVRWRERERKVAEKRSNSFSVEQLFEGNPIRFDFIQKHHRIHEGGKFFATSFYGDEIVSRSMNRTVFSLLYIPGK